MDVEDGGIGFLGIIVFRKEHPTLDFVLLFLDDHLFGFGHIGVRER